MKVFFSGSIRGGRQMLDTYRHICELIMEQEFEVLSTHVIDPALEEKESRMSEQEIYERDMGLLERSDCMVADVTIPSIGVGYEICSALRMGMPVLCVHSHQANVSSMILGNTSKNMRIRRYNSQEELKGIVLEFTDSFGENG